MTIRVLVCAWTMVPTRQTNWKLQFVQLILCTCCSQLLLRMHTAYFQSGTYVVDSLQPADRLLIIVSGRKALLVLSQFKSAGCLLLSFPDILQTLSSVQPSPFFSSFLRPAIHFHMLPLLILNSISYSFQIEEILSLFFSNWKDWFLLCSHNVFILPMQCGYFLSEQEAAYHRARVSCRVHHTVVKGSHTQLCWIAYLPCK